MSIFKREERFAVIAADFSKSVSRTTLVIHFVNDVVLQ